MGGPTAKSFNTIGSDGFARTATNIPITAVGPAKQKQTEPLKLVGHQRGDFFIAESLGQQNITHIPTGVRIHRMETLSQAKHFVKQIDSPQISKDLTTMANSEFGTKKVRDATQFSPRQKSDLLNKVKTAADEAKTKFPSKAKRDRLTGQSKNSMFDARVARQKAKEAQIDI